VNTAIASQSGNYQGYGFAVPSNLASKVAEDLIEYGEVRRALLGVTIVSVDARLADDLNMDTIRGVLISGLSPNGAAEQSGIQANDVILSVNGEEVNESNQLQQKIAVMRPGESVMLKLLRDNQVITKTVELGMLDTEAEQQFASSQPQLSQEPNDSSSARDDDSLRGVEFGKFDLGFRVMALARAGDQDGYDIVVTDVVDGSEAAQFGLKEGFVLRKVGDQKVEDLQSLKDLIAQFSTTSEITFEVETREGDIKTLESQQ